MSLTAGTAFGPYTIVGLAGTGGMGEVYKARDTRLDRTVALKILPQTNDAERQQRFEREARAISRLQHPHICTLFDVGSQDGVEYLVMEFLEGQTLAQRLEKGPLPLPELLQYAAEIADALEHAHRASVCHRDLKPANIMLTRSGVKLLDFGLARALGAESVPAGGETATLALTREGVILGTLPYMSPEQLEGKSGDARSDIFAFGAVLYEMATGRRAFDASSGASLITKIMSADPPSMQVLQPVTPPALERMVRRCLAKDAEQRWQSARDVALALELVVDQPHTLVPVRREARERIAWTLLAVALLAAAGLGVAYLWRVTPQASAVAFTIPPPDGAVFGVDSPAVSPDGKRVAFVASAGESTRLWVRSLDTLQARLLDDTDGAKSPFWSPDSKNIAFQAGAKLKRIPADGGAVQTLCDASNIRGGTWSQEGIIIFAPNPLANLYQVPASGGSPTPVTAFDPARAENSHRWPQFLPDGKRFLYFVRTGNPEDWAVYAGWLDPSQRSQRKQILKTRSNVSYVPQPAGTHSPGYLLHVRDSTLLAQPFDAERLQFAGEPVVVAERVAESTPQLPAQFSASPGLLTYGGGRVGVYERLIWFDRGGKRLSELASTDALYSRPALSPDGKRLAATTITSQTAAYDIVVIDLARGIPTRFTFGAGIINQNAVWSPDGRYIAYFSFRNGQPALVKKLADGSGPEEITTMENRQLTTLCDWSRDGKWILYSLPGQGTLTDLWLAPASGGSPRPFLQTKANDTCGQFSPDGKWVAYASDENGRFEVYVQAFPTGAKWQISNQGGAQPRWRHDGKEVFYRSPDGHLMAVDIRAGASIEAGIPKSLFPAPLTPVLTESTIDYDVSADGQKFVVASAARGRSTEPVTAVLNWTMLLKR